MALPPRYLALALLVGLVAFAARATEVEVRQVEDEPMSAPIDVLVTGFFDWKELGEPPNVRRCRDNPSCRLLVGEALGRDPTGRRFRGALARRLKERETEGRFRFHFRALPVTWGVARGVDHLEYDVVVHLGLGVYDRFDRILVEDGAFNQRTGRDAAGEGSERWIDRDEPEVLRPKVAALQRKLDTIDGASVGDFRVVTKAARADNDYLCNETHFVALQRLAESRAKGGRLQRAYFVHIPFAEGDDFEPLAAALEHVVVTLAD